MNGEMGEKIVRWDLDDIEMEATVTFPGDGKEYPGIVMIAGSGPTDRDWCSPLIPGSNGTGKLLAEALTKSGYATIRFDKRASGPYIQENVQKLMGRISMKGHAEEVESAVKALVENTNVSRENLCALTNSEGAIHALNYQAGASENKFSGLVLTGVPGRSVGDVAREQIFNQLKGAENPEYLMGLYDKAVSDFEIGKPYIPDPKIPESMDLLLRSITSPANQPFSLELWKMNPADLINEVPDPMLLLIGKKDIQVNWEVDGAILRRRLSGRQNITISFPENADHVLKYEPMPRDQIVPGLAGQNYNQASRDLDDETLGIMLGWLRENCSR